MFLKPPRSTEKDGKRQLVSLGCENSLIYRDRLASESRGGLAVEPPYDLPAPSAAWRVHRSRRCGRHRIGRPGSNGASRLFTTASAPWRTRHGSRDRRRL